MNIEEIKKFFADNKDDAAVKAFLAELSKVSEEQKKAIVDEWLKGPGAKELQSMADKEAEKKNKAFLENNLEKLVEAKYLEKHPPKDPHIAAMEAKLAEMEAEANRAKAEAAREKLRTFAGAYLTENKLSPHYVDFLIGNDEETTKANLEKFRATYDAELKTILDAKFKDAGREAPGGGGQPQPQNLQTAYDEAKKAGNIPMQVAIKRTAAAENFQLTE